MIQNGAILDGMYQIIHEIGQGGTGIIYLAEHLRLQKKVVVKKVKDNFVGQINGRAEVDILKRLHHTCLPQVYDFLVIDSSIYTVMEYVEGQDLQQYLDQGYQFPEQTVRMWLLQLSEVLEYLHTQSPPILHSDIKPANLMVTPQGNICLIDFNISLDGENSKDIQGISPWYAAPEQYEKAQNVIYGQKDRIVLDGRMDIYSLGATFYRVMTGLLPSPDRVQLQDIMYLDIPYSEGMKAVVSKAMKQQPAARFQTAGQMRKVLADVGRMDPVYRRYGYLQIAGGLVWILCVIAGVMCLYYGSWKSGIENWQRAYRELYVSVQEENETEIVSKATEMLNESRYQGYLEKHEEEHAKLLHTLGESYFRQEQFGEAASYYKEAWEMSPETGGYCKDYVIALVRDGQMAGAERVLQSAESLRGLSQSEQQLIEAQITWMQAMEEGEYAVAMTALEEVQEIQPSRDILRQLGQTAAEAASNSQRASVGDAYLKKALGYYQTLNESGSPNYSDRLNLALTQRAAGQYRNSNDTLKVMLQSYPDDYLISMWMCYNYLSMEDKSLLEDIKFRYKDCKHLYDISGESNQDMEDLIEIMEELGV